MKRLQREPPLHVRGAILAAARAVAADEGWQALTMRKIAGRIGYSAPVIYEHFESKEALLLALLHNGFRALLGHLQEARMDVADPEAALLAMGRAYRSFARDAPDLYQIMYGLGGVAFNSDAAAEAGRPVAAALAAAFHRLAPSGADTAREAAGRARLLWAALHGLIALEMAGPATEGPDADESSLEWAVRAALRTWGAA